jgi:hypothetical protein
LSIYQKIRCNGYLKNLDEKLINFFRENSKFSFRRTVNSRLMQLWYELVEIARGIQLIDEEDAMIWQFDSSIVFSVQSLYVAINDRRVKQVFTPVMWKIHVPPRILIFLWLLANNKTLTRNNLAKRREVSDMTCLVCNEYETTDHLFFSCCVVKQFWCVISEITGAPVSLDFESMAKWWLHGKNSVL